MLKAFDERGIEPKGKIGMHMSVVVETLEERMNGFKAYMAEHAPDLECLDTLYNENDVNNAQSNVAVSYTHLRGDGKNRESGRRLTAGAYNCGRR